MTSDTESSPYVNLIALITVIIACSIFVFSTIMIQNLLYHAISGMAENLISNLIAGLIIVSLGFLFYLGPIQMLFYFGQGVPFLKSWKVTLALTIVTLGIFIYWSQAVMMQGEDYEEPIYSITKYTVIGIIILYNLAYELFIRKKLEVRYS